MPKEKEKIEKEEKTEDKPLTLEEQLEKAKADVEHWKNEYFRAYADTKNLRSSLEADHKNAIKYRAEGFIEELLPVLDSFHVVLSNEPDDPKLRNYLTGFQFIYQNLVRVLEGEGVSEIAPKEGDTFDPNTMSAMDTVEEEPVDIIKKVNAKGYKLHDRLIRPAVVTVSVAKKEETNNESNEEKNETKSDA